MNMQTDVTVYLGDCTGDSLLIVCDGTSIESGGSMWQRALDALIFPSPRVPYPVSNRITLFVYETHLGAEADGTALAVYRVDIACQESIAYATVQIAESVTELSPVPCPIGDDAVTTARRVLKCAVADHGPVAGHCADMGSDT